MKTLGIVLKLFGYIGLIRAIYNISLAWRIFSPSFGLPEILLLGLVGIFICLGRLLSKTWFFWPAKK